MSLVDLLWLLLFRVRGPKWNTILECSARRVESTSLQTPTAVPSGETGPSGIEHYRCTAFGLWGAWQALPAEADP